jgi:ABC-type siderophore export system fused ATPase/permease subunit
VEQKKVLSLSKKYKDMDTVLLVVGLVTLLVTLFVKDIAGITTCGWPKSDEFYLNIIKKMKEKNIELINDMGHKGFITCLNPDIPYISGSITGLTFKYYVSGHGVVPRWYKSHKEITEIFNQLENGE